MTFPHWSRVTLYTSPCGFAQCCVFVKQSHGPFRCASGHCPGGPLLPKLRGHVAEFLNEVSPARLGIFAPSHLCRFWYGQHVSIAMLFLEAWTRGLGRASPSSVRPFPAVLGITVDPSRCPSPTSRLNPPCRCRNVDLLSIDYAFRPRLRCRLTPGGRTCPGKPWDSGDLDSHLVFRYSCPHNRQYEVHGRFRAPLQPVVLRSPTTGLAANPRIRHCVYSRSFSARGLSSSQLLRTV